MRLEMSNEETNGSVMVLVANTLDLSKECWERLPNIYHRIRDGCFMFSLLVDIPCLLENV